MSLLSGSIQPPLLTLLSSTSTPSLSPLFSSTTDPDSHESFIISISDDQRSEKNGSIPRHISRGNIAHSVVHTQSPDPRSAYIQAGSSRTVYRSRRASLNSGDGTAMPLGIELPWLGLQIKRLGRRDICFEVGVLDNRGREGVIRCSSFKKNPIVHPYRSPPLIHLPLNLPSPSKSQLTPWLHIPVNLSNLIPLFQALPRPWTDPGDAAQDKLDATRRKRRKVAELPSGTFGSVTYIRVYASCRLRRIWFSADGERTIDAMGKGVREEWELYAAEDASLDL